MSDIYSWLEKSPSDKDKTDAAPAISTSTAADEKPSDPALDVLNKFDTAYHAGAKKTLTEKVFFICRTATIFSI